MSTTTPSNTTTTAADELKPRTIAVVAYPDPVVEAAEGSIPTASDDALMAVGRPDRHADGAPVRDLRSRRSVVVVTGRPRPDVRRRKLDRPDAAHTGPAGARTDSTILIPRGWPRQGPWELIHG